MNTPARSPRLRRPLALLLIPVGVVALIGVLLVVIGMTRAPTASGTEVSADAGPFTVTIIVDDPTAGTQNAEVLVVDDTGVPIPDATVVFSATMASMGHAGQVITGQPSAEGRYQVDGDLFPMSGNWTARVSLERAGESTIATLPIVIEP
jgi:YtkA-like